MDTRSQTLRPWLWWLLPLALLVVLVRWELRRADSLDAALRESPVQAPGPVVVALLPEYGAISMQPGLGETAVRPLFNPTRKPAPPKTAEAARSDVPRGQFVLVGTTVSPEGSVALLREASGQRARAVRKGDRIDGLLVVDIRPDRVKLAASGHAEDLVFKPAPSPPRPPAPVAQVPAAASVAAAVRTPQVYQTPVPGMPQPQNVQNPVPNPAAMQPAAQGPVANPAMMQPAAQQPSFDPDTGEGSEEPPH